MDSSDSNSPRSSIERAQPAQAAPDTRGEIRRRSMFEVQRWNGEAWRLFDVFAEADEARAAMYSGRTYSRLIRVTETREVLS